MLSSASHIRITLLILTILLGLFAWFWFEQGDAVRGWISIALSGMCLVLERIVEKREEH